MASVADKLDEARALIEKGWTRGAVARDARGREVDVDDPRACRFCALGAVFVVGFSSARGTPLSKVIGTPWVAAWNDAQKSKRPVIEAFKRAAELARQEQSA